MEWISVKDDAPKIGEIVLIISLNRGVVADFLECIEGDILCFFNDPHPNYDRTVTHWMPLPELPKNL